MKRVAPASVLLVWNQVGWVPKWMRPGSAGARAWWVVTLIVAIVVASVGWSSFVGQGQHKALWFGVLWTLVLVVIVGSAFRTLWLRVGRRAEAMRRAIDRRDQGS